MDTEFKVTALGEYRMRNGEKAIVSGLDEHFVYCWEGKLSGATTRWMSEGRNLRSIDRSYDIIGPWVEPFTIDAPGDYITRDGRKAVVLFTAARGEYPAVGYIAYLHDDQAHEWTAKGFSVDELIDDEDNIVGMWREPVKIECGLYVYSDGLLLHDRCPTWTATATDPIATRRIRWDGEKIVDVTEKQ